MTATELDAIGTIAAKYRQVLTDQLHIITCRDLVLAERPAIVAAIRAAKKRPVPSLEDVAGWQDEARNHHTAVKTTAAEQWDRSATFVVCFQERRRSDHTWDRQIEVEHTELDSDQTTTSHQPGWDCQWVCSWMCGRIGLPDAQALASTGDASLAIAPAVTPAVPPSPPAAPSRPSKRPRAGLTLAALTLVDSTGRHPVTGDATTPLTVRPPAHLTVTVTGAPLPDDTRLTVRARTRGRRGGRTIWEEQVAAAGPTDIDLSSLRAGEHRLTLVAWTPGDVCEPALLKVPPLQVAAI